MKSNTKYKGSMSFTLGRGGDCGGDILKALDEDILFWESISSGISKRQYTHNDRSISINADWNKIIKQLKNERTLLDDFYSGRTESRLLLKPALIPVEIIVHSEEEEDEKDTFSHHYPLNFLEQYSYDVFLVTNLSRPGVCDFYNLTLSLKPTASHRKTEDPLRISSYALEYAWEESLEKEFPVLKEIPASETLLWYGNLNLGVRQKAQKPIEKALFSLLHICKTDGDISSVVWIFNALEAIFSTRVGEGFTNLISRIVFVLELTPKQESILKKSLRKLYDMRSALIHGGFEVYHPLRNEVLDKSMDSQFLEVYNNLQFGVSVIIACLQKMITNNSYGLTIKESVSYYR